MFSSQICSILDHSVLLDVNAESTALLSNDVDTLMNGNYKLVASIARNFNSKANERDDYFNAGVIGLMEAIEKFDVSRIGAVRFSTYAQWHIRKQMSMALDCDRGVHIPQSGKDTEEGNVSLLSMDGNDEGLSWHEVLGITEKDEDLEVEVLRLAMKKVALSEREQLIIRKGFGIDDAEPLTNVEIGSQLDCSGERVRQIRERALMKLGRVINSL
jgi:RNA polymerase primary sigma factor